MKERQPGIIQYDGTLRIATGNSRLAKIWKNKTLAWSELLQKLEIPVRTGETQKEYREMPKAQQDQIKDVGGFVGGALKKGRRRAESLEGRQLVTLDADYASPDLLEDLDLLNYYACALYSTHKHTPENPRLRVLIPLDREVSAEEYEAIARKLAEEMGMDYFDPSTFQPARMMYYPSVSSDGEYLFRYYDEPWVRADEVLARYEDWTDAGSWPESSLTTEYKKKSAKKQGDPSEKQGLIGAFCRTYDIETAIETFLSDQYLPCAVPGRYTYANGSTSAGLVIYEGKWAYSNHATDPAGGRLCNAFDLVRIHKYGDLDEEVDPETITTNLPSYKAMLEYLQGEDATKLTLRKEKLQEAGEDFQGEEGDQWLSSLEVDKKGNLLNSLNNVFLILRNDPMLQPIVMNQMADNLEIRGKVPWEHTGRFWRDADDAQLEVYLSQAYTEFSKARILSGVTKVADDRAYHPVREYLAGLPEWDGISRVDTLLIDYLGAEDTEYVRQVTRRTLCAAIARVQQPGCKFDTVLVLCGPQGIGKSTLIARLGGEWFSDSLNLADTRDKTAAEKLQGYWIIEIGEMAGIGSAGVKTLRSFITTQDDRYRASYGRRVSSHPRQCILIGTTNSADGYLNDVEGGRRFWPVNTPCAGRKKVWDMTREDVDQIWAEAVCRYGEGEPLILSGEAAKEAQKQQKEAMMGDPREEMVRQYLDTMLPEDWYSRSLDRRRDFLYGAEHPLPEATLRRDVVSAQEIWCECFGNRMNQMVPKDTYDIKKIMSKMQNWEYKGDRKRLGADYGMQRVYTRSGLDEKNFGDNLMTTS